MASLLRLSILHTPICGEDKGSGGKTTSDSGQDRSFQSHRRLWRTDRDGGSWLRDQRWCPNDPPSQAADRNISQTPSARTVLISLGVPRCPPPPPYSPPYTHLKSSRMYLNRDACCSPSLLSLRVVGSVSSPSDETKDGGPVCYRFAHVKDPTETGKTLPWQHSVEIPSTFRN